MTNVSLKIVRGVETKGIVDIMLESEMSGKIAATFQAKEEGISGLVVTDKQETRDLLADQMGFLASAIQESGGEQVDLRFAIEKPRFKSFFRCRIGKEWKCNVCE